MILKLLKGQRPEFRGDGQCPLDGQCALNTIPRPSQPKPSPFHPSKSQAHVRKQLEFGLGFLLNYLEEIAKKLLHVKINSMLINKILVMSYLIYYGNIAFIQHEQFTEI
jgi:hypothetical protein